MPSQQDIQDTILSAAYKNALAGQANYNLINQGGKPSNEESINYIWLNIDGLQYLLDLELYNTPPGITLYDRLNNYVGFDTTANSLDPNAQYPGITIEVVVTSPQPIPSIPWSAFDSGSELPDGGRVIYLNPAWAGFNPVLSLISPAETALTLGVDYTLLPTGGISLLNTGNLPEIYDGMFLRAVSYVTN